MNPSVVAMGQVSWAPFRNVAHGSFRTTTVGADVKYVGKQYWDNTENSDRCIPAYWVVNASLTHEFALRTGFLGLGLYVNNVLGRLYYADAWVYRAFFEQDGWYQEEGVFPQSPRNFMVKLSYRF